MLETMRKNASSFVIQLLFAAIVVVFVFWGVNTGGQRARPVAKVNGESVLDGTFVRAYQDRIRFMQRYNDNMTDEEIERIKNDVLDNLIIRELILQSAESERIVVSDHELASHIMDLRQFQDEEGHFDQDIYERELRRYRQSRTKFEENQREDLRVQRMEALVRRSVAVSEGEVREQYEEDNHKLNLEFVRISSALFRTEVDAGEERVATYLSEHATECRDNYDENFDRLYNQPKRVQASQIFMAIGPADDSALADEVRRRMADVLTEVKAGEVPFEDLAAKYSEHHTARYGGDLGFFDENRGGDPYGEDAFRTAAFSMAEGDISELVETSLGVHILQIEAVQEAVSQTFEEVGPEIAERLLVDEEAPALAEQYAEEVAMPFSQGQTPTELLDRHSIRVQQTDLFPVASPSIPRIGAAPELLGAALAQEEVGKGPPTAFRVLDNWIVFRVIDEQKPDPAGFAAAREEVESTLLRRKRHTRLQAWRDSLKEDADITIFDIAL